MGYLAFAHMFLFGGHLTQHDQPIAFANKQLTVYTFAEISYTVNL